jgi:hypothetical protein
LCDGVDAVKNRQLVMQDVTVQLTTALEAQRRGRSILDSWEGI